MFDFVDLFAGIGGFHAALSGMGGRAVLASEIDRRAAAVYELNWGLKPEGDVRLLADDPVTKVPDHALLTGGFPCQPFSKSGRQLGILEDRGTLFREVLAILAAKKPAVVMLENVRNIAGPRQRDAWAEIVSGLRDVGYRVSSEPCVFSPHLLSPEEGGAAQTRERVYILGVYVGSRRARKETDCPPAVRKEAVRNWDPANWSVEQHVLLPELSGLARQKYVLSAEEIYWVDVWNELLGRLGSHVRLPGFPLWETAWRNRRPRGYATMPSWKRTIIEKNRSFYLQNRTVIDNWRTQPRRVSIDAFPESRRKLEWQAGGSPRDLWKQLLQFRPSGIRVKQPSWTPALVAMNQTAAYGPQRRRLTPMETARLQGFDITTFTFGDQPDSASYKQMGNAVNVGAVQHVLRAFVKQNETDIHAYGRRGTGLVDAIGGL